MLLAFHWSPCASPICCSSWQLSMDTGWFRHQQYASAATMQGFLPKRHSPKAGQPFDRGFFRALRTKHSGPAPPGGLRPRSTDPDPAEGRTAYTEVRSSDYLATGAVPSDTEDLVNYCRSVAGVDVSLRAYGATASGGIKVGFSRPFGLTQPAWR